MRNLAAKKEIRASVSAKRKRMDLRDWKEKTDAIAGKVLVQEWFREASDIYCYVDCKKEAGTRRIIEEAWGLGKAVWVPAVHGHTMEFYQIKSFHELRPGGFGLMEPAGGIAAEGRTGLVIIPGVAFDPKRNRAGYGGGYYDKYLSAHPDLHTIAIAFDMQIVEEVPCGERDIRPEILITETRTFEEA